MMKRHWAFAGLLSSALVSAQTPEAPPPQIPLPPPPQATTDLVPSPLPPSLLPAPIATSNMDLNMHQTAAGRLKAEREALEADCARMEKAITEAVAEDK